MDALQMKSRDGRKTTLDRQVILELKRSLQGVLLAPEDQGYDERRKVWNGLIDKRPALIARCAGVPDVVTAVNFARERDLLISVRAGGHHVAGKALCDDGLVIDLSEMRSVRMDAAHRTVRVAGGATLGDIDQETHPLGLAVPVGLVSATGVAGLTLHGGMGWLTRKYGLTLDNLVSVEVVTADGQVLNASDTEHADLFWAIRGGGGNFGIVTSFEFCAQPIGRQVWFAAPIYPMAQAKRVLQFARDYMKNAPEELGLLATLWSAPDDPRVPAEHHGEPVVILLGCCHGSLERGAAAIGPLSEIVTPLADLGGPMRFAEVQRFFDADYPDGMSYYWKSLFPSDLSDEFLEAVIAHALTRPSPLTTLDIWFIGGALNRVPPDQTAWARRDAQYMLALESNWTDSAQSEANIAWTRAVFEDMQRFAYGSYLNFPGYMEDSDKLLHGAYGDNYERLRAVKTEYDPDNLFRGALNIPPRT